MGEGHLDETEEVLPAAQSVETAAKTKKRRSGSRGRRGNHKNDELQTIELPCDEASDDVSEEESLASTERSLECNETLTVADEPPAEVQKPHLEAIAESRTPAPLPSTPLPPAPKVLVLRKSSSHPGERTIESRTLGATIAVQTTSAPAERHQRGIRTQGESLSHWWSKRWNDFLEQFHAGQSLVRGRNDARFGAVTKIQIDVGSVTAVVQGALGEALEVGLGLDPIDDDAWDRILERLLNEPIFAARLLAGDLPEEIEAVFEEEECTLFPRQPSDLVTFCSCPDGDHFCQHIAAVYYLLCEEFERDPFLIFRLRGRDRADLVEALQEDLRAEEFEEEVQVDRAMAESLPQAPAVFWGNALPPLPPDAEGDWQLPKNLAAGLARRLGTFPFWRGSEPFLDSMDGIYATAAITTLDTLLRERQPPDPEELARRLAEVRPEKHRAHRRGKALRPPLNDFQAPGRPAPEQSDAAYTQRKSLGEQSEAAYTQRKPLGEQSEAAYTQRKPARKSVAGRTQITQAPRLIRSHRRRTPRPQDN